LPTGAALVFLRPYCRFWQVLSRLCLTIAITGVAAVALFAAGRHMSEPSPLAGWAALSVLRILLAPLLALSFLVCTALSPYRMPRLVFLAATVLEATVSIYGGYVWFFPILLNG